MIQDKQGLRTSAGSSAMPTFEVRGRLRAEVDMGQGVDAPEPQAGLSGGGQGSSEGCWVACPTLA